MSKRKTYGEIAYNAALKPYIVRGGVFEWKDTPPSVKAEYERAAKAVLSAYDRRKKCIIKTLDADLLFLNAKQAKACDKTKG